MAAATHSLVHETTTSTGTGNLTLTTPNGKRSFNSAFGTGGTDVFYYFISSQSAAEYEWGTGHLSASTTLVRDTVIGSSNSNAAVSFSSGTKDVACDIPAANQIINPLTTRGDIIRRGSSTYERLALGSAGQKLYSDGTDAAWNGGRVQIATASPTSVTTSAFTSIPQTYSSLLLIGSGISSDTASRELRMWLGVGGSYDTTSANYRNNADGSNTDGILTATSQTAAQITNFYVQLIGYQSGWTWANTACAGALTAGTTSGWAGAIRPIFYTGTTSAIDSIQLAWSGSGNFDAGTWTLYGMV